MASFRKRGDKWQARVCIDGVQKAFSFDTKAKAKAWAASVETKINNGEYKAKPNHTFSETLTRYAAEVSTKKRGERWETIRLNAWHKLPFAHYLLADITTPMLAEWRDLRLKSVQNSTVNREFNLLASVFEHARIEWHWTDHNPVRDVKRPPQPTHRVRVYSDLEIAAICSALGYSGEVLTKHHIIAVAFLFAIETAMRREEITGLVWDRVDIERRTVKLDITKNGEARDVPLTKEAVRLLGIMRGFKRPFDVDKDVLSTLFRRACLSAGINNAHFHDARRTALTRLALSGKISAYELARIAGHKDLKMALVYFNTSAEDIAKKLD
jgi:integrase